MIDRQFLVYAAVGLLSAALDVGLMRVLMVLNVHYLAAATLGFVFGLTVNLILHSNVTFKKNISCRIFVRYMIVVVVNCSLTLLGVQVFNQLLSMPVLGKVVLLPLIAINGFFLSKCWIYEPAERI